MAGNAASRSLELLDLGAQMTLMASDIGQQEAGLVTISPTVACALRVSPKSTTVNLFRLRLKATEISQ